jgi:hypothetical protein
MIDKTMLKIAVGHSNDPESWEAILEVLEQCQKTLNGSIPQAGILFAAIGFDHELILKIINETFPHIELIGGTTDGELSSVLEFQQDSLTLMLFCSDEVEIRAAVGRNVSQDPVAIAHQAVETAKSFLKAPPLFCISIPESLTTSATAILEGLTLGMGDAPVMGGAAADQTKAEKVYQFYKTEVLCDSVPVLLFAGNILFSHGVASGWHPIGKQGIVTKVERNIIYEIDGKPALAFYQHYFDDFTPDAAYPLAVFPPKEDRFFLRGPLGHDPIVGSVTISGDIPEQSIVQITEASQADILTASLTAFEEALNTYPGKEPAAALFFSCAWRRWILGTQTAKEYQAISERVAADFLSCGFYTYGEISPLSQQGQTFFHNTTFTALLIGVS